MQLGVALLIAKDVIIALEDAGLLKADGTINFADITADVRVVAIVEQKLKQRGAVIPQNIDRILFALPVVLSLFRH